MKRENTTARDSVDIRLEGKLDKRANKKYSTRKVIPREMLQDKENLPALGRLTEKIGQLSSRIPLNLLLFSLAYLYRKDFIRLAAESGITIEDYLTGAAHYPILQGELKSYCTENKIPLHKAIPEDLPSPDLLTPELLKEPDLPGLVYQALRQEGGKIREGAYFTPISIIREILRSCRIGEKTVFLDPCCGSGMFLCSFADITGRPEEARGMDRDRTAVFLARINLFIRFPSLKTLQHIRRTDALLTESWNLPPGTLVATNPPWGAHLTASEKKIMKERTRGVRTGETFSFFISRAIEELPEQGTCAFLLPESVLYVKTHQDIRKRILELAPPLGVTHYGPLFHGVYTPVISMILSKGASIRKTDVNLKGIKEGGISEKQPVKGFQEAPFSMINIHCTNRDSDIIRKVETGRSLRLGSCRWLLGIVTGDNSRFLTGTPDTKALPVLSGKEIRPFMAGPPCRYLRTDRGTWQQSRKPKEYLPDKIVYTFIGTTPSFALDKSGIMTLNSANCLIPEDPELLAPLTGWYNSTLFRFCWRKQFHSVKLLRSHLEILPVPDWGELEKQELTDLVKMGEKGEDVKPKVDQILFDFYDFSRKEREYVASQV